MFSPTYTPPEKTFFKCFFAFAKNNCEALSTLCGDRAALALEGQRSGAAAESRLAYRKPLDAGTDQIVNVQTLLVIQALSLE